MTLSSTITSTTLTGNGSSTTWDFAFYTWDETELELWATIGDADSVQITDDYSVSLNSDQDTSPGGTITYPVSADALTSSDTLTIQRSMPFTQTADPEQGQGFDPDVIETALDRATAERQQLAEAVTRCAQVDPGEDAGEYLEECEAAEAASAESESAAAASATAAAASAVEAASAASSVTVLSQEETATAGQTLISLDWEIDTENPNYEVYLDGVKLAQSAVTVASSTSLTFDALVGGELIEVLSASSTALNDVTDARDTAVAAAASAEISEDASASSASDSSSYASASASSASDSSDYADASAVSAAAAAASVSSTVTGVSVTVMESSGTYTPPAGAVALKFTLVAGGGAAGDVTASGTGAAAAPSGGGGATCIKHTTTIDSSYAVVIGAGGVESAGGDSTVISTNMSLYAEGGDLGLSVTATTGYLRQNGAAGGGSVTGGDLNITGGNSTPVIILNGYVAQLSQPGSSAGGGPNNAGTNVATGTAGYGADGGNKGSGGGSSILHSSYTGTRTGGEGADGVLIVEEFYND